MSEFNRRGLMLDCSRNAVMTVPAVKDLIEKMKDAGYNFLMLYTEDTYEIPAEPLFGYLRGRYTQAELKEIDDYAFSRGVEVVPCIQTLAHLNQIFAWDRFKRIQDQEAVLMVGEEETYELIDKMFASVSSCFRSRILHIGMDEAHALGRGKYLDKHGFRMRTELLMEHLIKVCDIAKKYGYTVNMWGDMFYCCVNDGEYFDRKTSLSDLPAWVKESLPSNLVLTYWDYYHETAPEYAAYIQGHQELEKPVWFAGGLWRWVGYTPANKITVRRTAEALRACRENGVQDVFVCAWGDDGCECPFDAVLPTLFSTGEQMNGNDDLEDIKRKFEKKYEQSFDDMLLFDFDLPYVTRHDPKRFSFQNGIKAMLYSDPFFGKFDCTVEGDGCESAQFADLAGKLQAAMERSKHFKPLFENFWRLARIMSKKYDLGYRTRTAYQKGDKEGLRNIVKDYEFLITELPLYIDNFEKVWLAQNKANGLETVQIRLGGLLQRLKTCKRRLEGYLSGEIERVDELLEKIQGHRSTESGSAQPMTIIKYKDAVSPNIF